MGIAPRRDAPAITATRHVVLEAIRKAVPAGRRTVLVAVDGRGGAGKSTLAAWLAERLGATIVHTDDLAGWKTYFASAAVKSDWFDYLRDSVLEPLSRDRPGRFIPRDWRTGEAREAVEVQPGGVVILEGVSASRAELGDMWDVTVWVDCPADVRIARGLERDGAEAIDDWMRWEAEENAFFAARPLFERAQFVVDGLDGV